MKYAMKPTATHLAAFFKLQNFLFEKKFKKKNSNMFLKCTIYYGAKNTNMKIDIAG